MYTNKMIKAALQQATFNPQLPGPMKIVAEANNLDYFRHRAIESIHAGNLKQAIQLLALCIAYPEAKNAHPKAPRKRQSRNKSEGRDPGLPNIA
jgi:hypothetical protein